jgi:hypothetical protein
VKDSTTKVNEYKIRTIPILMHQMCISTTQVSSVVLGPKKLEIRKKNCENWIRAGKNNQILCHEIESNLSKDRDMHEGDNPLL